MTTRASADATNAAAIAAEVSARQAMLVSGKLDPTLLPALAIGDTFVVNSQAAMLALTAQQGDIAKRTDIDGGAPYILTTNDPTQVGNWLRLTGDYALAGDLSTEVARAMAVEAPKADSQVLGLDAIGSREVATLLTFTDWLSANQVKGYIGEVGWSRSADTSLWNAIGDKYYSLSDSFELWTTYWATGEGVGRHLQLARLRQEWIDS